jgi:hypothetical protein
MGWGRRRAGRRTWSSLMGRLGSWGGASCLVRLASGVLSLPSPRALALRADRDPSWAILVRDDRRGSGAVQVRLNDRVGKGPVEVATASRQSA